MSKTPLSEIFCANFHADMNISSETEERLLIRARNVVRVLEHRNNNGGIDFRAVDTEVAHLIEKWDKTELEVFTEESNYDWFSSNGDQEMLRKILNEIKKNIPKPLVNTV